MSNYNRCVLVGRIVRDPELNKTNSGKAVTTFSLAVNRTFSKDKDAADFFDVNVWDKLAENFCAYKKKGELVLVEGRLQTRSWDDKNTGQKRSKVEVVADNIQFLPSKADGGSSGGGGSSMDDDNIPF